MLSRALWCTVRDGGHYIESGSPLAGAGREKVGHIHSAPQPAPPVLCRNKDREGGRGGRGEEGEGEREREGGREGERGRGVKEREREKERGGVAMEMVTVHTWRQEH